MKAKVLALEDINRNLAKVLETLQTLIKQIN